MSAQTKADQETAGDELNLFCSVEGDAWRVHVRPTRLPRYLQHCFDESGEAYPVLLDFEDLARHMEGHGASFEKRESKAGGVELLARGASATELAIWLSTAFASGVRPGG